MKHKSMKNEIGGYPFQGRSLFLITSFVSSLFDFR